MKIVMLTNHITPDRLGGLGRYVRELSGVLQERGHEVTIITKRVDAADPAMEIDASGTVILRHDSPTRSDPIFLVKYPASLRYEISSRLRTIGRSDDVILHGHYAFASGALIRSHARSLYTFHAPVHKEILHEGGRPPLHPVLRGPAVAVVRRHERRILQRAGSVVVLSDFMRREAETIAPGCSGRVRVVPGGLDTSVFTPRPDRTTTSTERPELFAARRLVPRTGVVQLIEAMVRVSQEYPGAKLSIAGDGVLAPMLRARIDELGLRDNITLLGRISDEDLVSRYQSADLAITPTLELEGFGLSTAEAMACGTPVLVTPVGANPELVAPLGAQHLCAGVSGDAIADGVLRMLSGGSLSRQSYRDRALAWSWPTIAAAYEEAYASLPSGA